MEIAAKIKPFIFHGITVASKDDNNYNCHCFSCGKERHLNISIGTGQWKCLVCNARGNVFSFLSQLYELCLGSTTLKHYAELSKERKVSVAALKAWGFAYNHFNNTWLIPGVNLDKKIINLYKCERYEGDDGSTKWLVLNTPGCKITAMNLHNTSQKKVYICEGPWDGMAMWDILTTIGYNTEKGAFYKAKTLDTSLILDEGVIALPGVTGVPPDLAKGLNGRKVVICFDNDHPRTTANGNVIKPGWDGTMYCCKSLSKGKQRPEEITYLQWGTDGFDPKLPDGYDIRDLATSHPPHISYRKVQIGLHLYALGTGTSANAGEEEDEEETVEPITRTSFKELCNDWRSKLHFPESLRTSVAWGIAILFSTTIDGEQIWGRFIGQPGTGKTTLAEALAAAKKYTKSLSLFTGFHSGSEGKNGEETSLIPGMNGKMLIIKDGDTLLTATGRDRILAELRDIYDGVSRAQYRTGKKSVHSNLRISIMLCGTDTLRMLNRSSLGERFIDIEIVGEDKADHAKYVKTAIASNISIVSESIGGDPNRPKANPYVKQCTLGYVNHLKDLLASRAIVVPTMTDNDAYVIECMANYVAAMRARQGKDDEGLSYKPKAELGTRLGAQYVKAAICLAVVLNKKQIDLEVMKMIQWSMHSTTRNYRSDIVNILSNSTTGATKLQLAITLNLPETTVDSILNEMLIFGICKITKQSNNSGNRGRKANYWTLTSDFQEIYTVSSLVNYRSPKPTSNIS